MGRVGCVIAIAIPVLLFAFWAVVVFEYVNSSDDSDLEYMLDKDDPTGLVPVAFNTGEIHRRLDDSGHRHGEGRTVPPDVLGVSLDNDCQVAWFEIESPLSLRIVGVDAFDECDQQATRDSLIRAFKEQLVPRLEGQVAPLVMDEQLPDGTPHEWAAGQEPVVVIGGTLDDARKRLDTEWPFEHEVHDNVFYLGEFGCYGRFRLESGIAPSTVRVIGVGYTQPCEWGSEPCLRRIFEFLLLRAGDPTQTSSAGPTPIAPPTPCRIGD